MKNTGVSDIGRYLCFPLPAVCQLMTRIDLSPSGGNMSPLYKTNLKGTVRT